MRMGPETPQYTSNKNRVAMQNGYPDFMAAFHTVPPRSRSKRQRPRNLDPIDHHARSIAALEHLPPSRVQRLMELHHHASHMPMDRQTLQASMPHRSWPPERKWCPGGVASEKLLEGIHASSIIDPLPGKLMRSQTLPTLKHEATHPSEPAETTPYHAHHPSKTM